VIFQHRKRAYLYVPQALAGSIAFVLLVACGPDDPGALRVAWTRAPVLGQGGWLGRPGVSGTTVVFEDGGELSAVDARTGKVLWSTLLRQGVNLNADNVAIGGDLAFAAGGDSVYAVNVATGARVWAFLPDEQGAPVANQSTDDVAGLLTEWGGMIAAGICDPYFATLMREGRIPCAPSVTSWPTLAPNTSRRYSTTIPTRRFRTSRLQRTPFSTA